MQFTGRVVTGEVRAPALRRNALQATSRFIWSWSKDWGGALTVLLAVYLLVGRHWQLTRWALPNLKASDGQLTVVLMNLAAVIMAVRASRLARSRPSAVQCLGDDRPGLWRPTCR